MQILPISLNNNNNRCNFKAKLMLNESAGMLKRSTSYDVEGILHAYRDIMSKLNSKTEEGLDFIRKNFPNITIGEGLTFHNCGLNKTSILIRCAEDLKYMGLTRIIVREGRTYEASRRIKDSFMLYNHDRAVTNFDERHSKQFPNESKLATADELQKTNYDERLSAVLKDLDEAMLPFRIFLSKNMNSYQKKPDGKLTDSIKNKLKEIDNLYREIDDVSAKLMHKTLLELKRNFKSYILTSGLTSHDFKNLGAEKYTIHCAEVESARYNNLKRLMVTDKDGFYVAGFLIKDNDKIVKNVNPKTLYIPDKLVYLNEDEIGNSKLLADFEKYTDLYLRKLNAYKIALIHSAKPKPIRPKLELSKSSQKNFKEGFDSFGILLQLLKSENYGKEYISLLKQNGIGYISPTRGIAFSDYNGDMQLHVLPVRSNKHSGLVRITISDRDYTNQQMYLVKDFKHIVKNYNQSNPLSIPKVLNYVEEGDGNSEVLSECSEYFSTKLSKVLDLFSAANIAEIVKPVKKQKINKPVKKDDEAYNKFVRECYEDFKYAMKNIGSSLGEFQMTMSKISQKVAQYYNEHNK